MCADCATWVLSKSTTMAANNQEARVCGIIEFMNVECTLIVSEIPDDTSNLLSN